MGNSSADVSVDFQILSLRSEVDIYGPHSGLFLKTLAYSAHAIGAAWIDLGRRLRAQFAAVRAWNFQTLFFHTKKSAFVLSHCARNEKLLR